MTETNTTNSDYKKDIVDIMMESQEYRSLIFHIASISPEAKAKLDRPALWKEAGMQ